MSARRNFALSIVSIGFAAAGAVVYAPFTLLCLPGAFYLSAGVIRGAYRAIVHKANMNVDVVSAIAKIVLLVSGHFVFCCLSLVCYTMSKLIRASIRDHSGQRMIDAFTSNSQFAWVLADGEEVKVRIENLSAGAIVVVGSGENIPVDGEIVAGNALIDQMNLTGEAQPVERGMGQKVLAATTVLSGGIQIRVERPPSESRAAAIANLLNETIDKKTNLQIQAEGLTDKTVLPTLLVSAIAYPIAGFIPAMIVLQSHPKYRMINVSVTGLFNYLSLASKNGILIKDASAFERLSHVKTVVFDKTGTLTTEVPTVAAVHGFENTEEADVMAWAAAMERKQEHPIAYAINNEAVRRRGVLKEVTEIRTCFGFGLSGRGEHGEIVHIGSSRFIQSLEIARTNFQLELERQCLALVNTVVWVAIDKVIVGAIEIEPTIRPEIQATVSNLRELGVEKIFIVSGDKDAPTKKLSKALKLDGYFAETLPERKSEIVHQIQQDHGPVCFVGDGINDSAAMRAAAVAVSLRGASSIARDTAQIIIMASSLDRISKLFEYARKARTSGKLSCSTIGITSVGCLVGGLAGMMGLGAILLTMQLGWLLGLAASYAPHLELAHQSIRKTPSPGNSR